MLNIIALVLRLTVFVDSCDADSRTCVVYAGIYDEDDAGPLSVSMTTLPACAAEGLLIDVASGTCATPIDPPVDARNDNGADIDLNAPDHGTWCPATTGHKVSQ